MSIRPSTHLGWTGPDQIVSVVLSTRIVLFIESWTQVLLATLFLSVHPSGSDQASSMEKEPPDALGIVADEEVLPDAESLAESLPDAESGAAESLPNSDDESDDELLLKSCVAPVPGEMPQMRDDPRSPSARKGDLPGTCCSRNCCDNIQNNCAAELSSLQTLKGKLSNNDADDFVFKLLLGMRVHKRIRFKLFGRYLGRTGFSDCIGISNFKLRQMLNLLKDGHLQPPCDLRHSSAAER